MAHHAARSGYDRLVGRLNKYPQGAPPSELLYKILKMLMSEREAGLVALVPIKPFTASTAARAWKMSLAEAQGVLDGLADRALLVDAEGRRGRTYVLPPPMAGFFEFSMMRLRGDLDQKLLAELYYQYITVEEDFIKALFTEGETSSTMRGRARSSRRPLTAASGSVIAATKWSTPATPATPPSTSV